MHSLKVKNELECMIRSRKESETNSVEKEKRVCSVKLEAKMYKSSY